MLQADGSIRWSEAHRAQFTAERRDREVALAVAERRGRELAIDPAAVIAVGRLLGLLEEQRRARRPDPPAVQPGLLPAGREAPLRRGPAPRRGADRGLAAAHGATVVGSFDPAIAGCSEDMYIDAEHGSPACLRRVLAQVPGL